MSIWTRRLLFAVGLALAAYGVYRAWPWSPLGWLALGLVLMLIAIVGLFRRSE